MARRTNIEMLYEKIPAEYHNLLQDKTKVDMITQLMRLDNDVLRTVFKSVPEDLKPIFKSRLESEPDGRGAKSLLPYSKEEISKAGRYLSMKAGDKIKDSEGTDYTLATVQVLIKAKSGDKISTIALSRMAD